MGAATVQARLGTGATVSWANAENNGIVYSREDSATGTTPVPVPTATGTNFSWIKNLVLYVTAAGTTTITNRRIALSTAASTGLAVFWKAVATASYAQASSSNQPAASGSNGATPSGYTLMSATSAQYDNASVATSSTGPNGSMAVCVLGVDFTYAGGAGSAIGMPNILLFYDEA